MTSPFLHRPTPYNPSVATVALNGMSITDLPSRQDDKFLWFVLVVPHFSVYFWTLLNAQSRNVMGVALVIERQQIHNKWPILWHPIGITPRGKMAHWLEEERNQIITWMNTLTTIHPRDPPLSIESILSTRLSKLDAETNSVCPPMGDSLSQDLLESDDQRQGRFHVGR